MWWIILFILIGLFLIFRLFIFMFGNWRATLNKVITQYIAWKQMEPNYSDEQVFMAVLDHRYPEKRGYFAEMNRRKDETKEMIKEEVEDGSGLIKKFNLPILIYACLIIEDNSYMHSPKSNDEILNEITNEVKRQGFEKYC